MEDGTRIARKGILLHSTLAVLTGCLCCLTPLVLVLFGLASISTAIALDNVLTGQYVWVFLSVALLLQALALVVYFRRRGVCTLDQARRQRNRIMNTILLTLLFAIGTYIAFEYVVLGYLGVAVGLPWAPPRWAFVWSAALLGAGVLLLLSTRLVGRIRKDAHSPANSPKAASAVGIPPEGARDSN